MHPNHPHSITSLIESTSYRLNEAVLRSLPKSGFDVNAIPAQQAVRIKLLPRGSGAFNASWDTLAGSRRSAACRYEWARLQMFLAAEILPLLQDDRSTFYHVTLADKRWRVAPSEAGKSNFDAPRRKVRAAIQALRDGGFKPVFVAAYEMSGDDNLAGDYAFEPHVHLLIGGVSSTSLRTAFHVRLPRASRGKDKPLRVDCVPTGELGNVLAYITKNKAQDRVEFTCSDGRISRQSNRMPMPQAADWVRCMATMPITKMIQFGGFAESITERFARLEMATLIGKSR